MLIETRKMICQTEILSLSSVILVKSEVRNLREVGLPHNTKRRQNSLNRLCSVCAVKKIVCAALFF